jgi:hypothetical protein
MRRHLTTTLPTMEAMAAICLEKHPEAKATATWVNDSNELNLLGGPDPHGTLNPQNWNLMRKNLVFVALMSSSILADG